MNTLSMTRLSVLLAAFVGVTYTLCVLYGFSVPEAYRMHSVWDGLLPGFRWLTWGTFFIGLGEVLAYGVFFAVLYWLLRRVMVLDLDNRDAANALHGSFFLGGR